MRSFTLAAALAAMFKLNPVSTLFGPSDEQRSSGRSAGHNRTVANNRKRRQHTRTFKRAQRRRQRTARQLNAFKA